MSQSSFLDLHEGMSVCFVSDPIGYVAGLHLPSNITVKNHTDGLLDRIQYFVTTLYELDLELPQLKGHIKPETGRLWVCWPSPESGAETDLDEGKIKQVLAKNDMTGVQVAEVDDLWMGMECR
jgi:hypothetical protein